MAQQCGEEAGRPPLLVGRAVILAALGTGLWLASEATASAAEVTPPLPALATTVSDVTEVAAPAEEVVAPATSALVPAAVRPSVVHAVAPVPEAVVTAIAPAA